MSINSQIKKLEHYQVNHRSGIERFCTLVLTAATIFSITGLGHDEQRQRAAREAITATMPTFSPAEKNETVRMPIKFDDGLRSIATTGE